MNPEKKPSVLRENKDHIFIEGTTDDEIIDALSGWGVRGAILSATYWGRTYLIPITCIQEDSEQGENPSIFYRVEKRGNGYTDETSTLRSLRNPRLLDKILRTL